MAMKVVFKKIITLMLALVTLAAVVPFSANAASYENPAFGLTVVSESGSELVVTLDLKSGSFNCVDFGFVAASGYTCTKIVKGSVLAAFVDKCDDSGQTAPVFAFNSRTGLISFASSALYGEKGAFVKATFSKSGGKSYKAGDIKIEFSNCAITVDGKAVNLSPTFSLYDNEITLKYHQSYQLEAPGKNYKWSTSNKKVAIVNDKGEVHAGIKGTATITATNGTETIEYIVNVRFTGMQSLMYYVLFGFIWMKPKSF